MRTDGLVIPVVAVTAVTANGGPTVSPAFPHTCDLPMILGTLAIFAMYGASSYSNFDSRPSERLRDGRFRSHLWACVDSPVVEIAGRIARDTARMRSSS